MAQFHEDGMVCDVDVLRDNSDDEWESYELKVNNIIQHSSIFKSPEIGEVFSVDKKKNVGGCCGLWHLFGYEKAVAELSESSQTVG